MAKRSRKLAPIHPGEILREELMRPLGLTASGLARDLRVPVTRINDILRCRRAVSADTALRLARYFGTTARFWINLQAAYDLDVAERKGYAAIRQEVLPRKAA
jgi:addiction module HigA family antidote